MSAHCCGHDHHHIDPHRGNAGYRRVLWAVLAINATMFLVEIGAGVAAGSASLQADALDFFGDAANYAISLFVIGMALRYRAYAALGKGISMGVFGLWVIGTVIWHAAHGTLPSAVTMGAVGLAAFAANAASFALLWAYRAGDANMRSAWICTRNDAIGNLAVLLAAAGVFGTGTGWPDLVVATIMAGLALQGAWMVIRQSLGELRQPVPASGASQPARRRRSPGSIVARPQDGSTGRARHARAHAAAVPRTARNHHADGHARHPRACHAAGGELRGLFPRRHRRPRHRDVVLAGNPGDDRQRRDPPDGPGQRRAARQRATSRCSTPARHPPPARLRPHPAPAGAAGEGREGQGRITSPSWRAARWTRSASTIRSCSRRRC